MCFLRRHPWGRERAGRSSQNTGARGLEIVVAFHLLRTGKGTPCLQTGMAFSCVTCDGGGGALGVPKTVRATDGPQHNTKRKHSTLNWLQIMKHGHGIFLAHISSSKLLRLLQKIPEAQVPIPPTPKKHKTKKITAHYRKHLSYIFEKTYCFFTALEKTYFERNTSQSVKPPILSHFRSASTSSGKTAFSFEICSWALKTHRLGANTVVPLPSK